MEMGKIDRTVIVLYSLYAVLFLFLVSVYSCEGQNLSANQLNTEFDRLLSAQFKPDETGCAALVAKGGRIVYKKAFGMADLEFKIPMQPDMVFRIGSITKQFTAVAILQLVEQGRMSLQDEIKKYIPDYPTNGHVITIEHLLTHTSGIKSYTNVPEFREYIRLDKTPEETINMFKNLPMEFAPGTKWNYNNSGYFLLGYIIEKVSGQSYPEYITENFFKKLGMNNTYYGSDKKIIRNRASGYQPGADGVENAEIMSMTLPYAAGSIQSTVEDLFIWHQALHTYKILRKETLEKAFTEYRLSDGRGTHYGYGWFLREIQGNPTIEHGGGINGFLTNAIYLPDQDVFVAVFSNSNGKSPDMVSMKMAALAIGNPLAYKDIEVDEAILEEYVGVYVSENGNERSITTDKGKLYSQRTGSSRNEIRSFAPDRFYFDNSFTRIEFRRDENRKVISIVVDDRGTVETWTKTERKPTVKVEIKFPGEMLALFTGEYQLAPGFVITVTREGDRLFTQATGQPRIEVFAESENRFFPREVDATLEFVRDESGKPVRLILFQGGGKIEGPKIN